MQRTIDTDNYDDDCSGNSILNVGARSRVHQNLRNEIEENRPQQCPEITALPTKNVRSTENDRSDDLKFKAERHACGFDRLHPCHVNERGKRKENAPDDKGADL